MRSGISLLVLSIIYTLAFGFQSVDANAADPTDGSAYPSLLPHLQSSFVSEAIDVNRALKFFNLKDEKWKRTSRRRILVCPDINGMWNGQCTDEVNGGTATSHILHVTQTGCKEIEFFEDIGGVGKSYRFMANGYRAEMQDTQEWVEQNTSPVTKSFNSSWLTAQGETQVTAFIGWITSAKLQIVESNNGNKISLPEHSNFQIFIDARPLSENTIYLYQGEMNPPVSHFVCKFIRSTKKED